MANDYLPYFKFFPRDYLASPSVMLMTLAEQGAYIRMLSLQWENGRIQPRHLRGLLQCSQEECDELMSGSLGECFVLDEEGNLYNERLDGERKEAMQLIEKRRAAGFARARKSSAHAGQPTPYTKAEAKAEAKTKRRSAVSEHEAAVDDWQRINGPMPSSLLRATEEYLALRKDQRMPLWSREMWLRNLSMEVYTVEEWCEAYATAIRSGWRSVHPRKGGKGSMPPSRNGNPFIELMEGESEQG